MGKPTSNRLLIKVDKVIDTNPSPILIAGNKKEKPQTGLVLEVGPDVLKVKPGHKVQFGISAGTEISDEHITVREDEIYYNFSL